MFEEIYFTYPIQEIKWLKRNDLRGRIFYWIVFNSEFLDGEINDIIPNMLSRVSNFEIIQLFLLKKSFLYHGNKKKKKISRYLSAILEANGISCPILKMCNTDIRNLNNKSGNLYWLMRWKLSRKTFSQEQSSFYLAKMSLCDQRR